MLDLTRPFGSVWTPKLDGSEILYAPLWHPTMVAKGGDIVNGTGTMDVSPQRLVVGANTINVSVAGTLIVTMPEGGTVATGTMTVDSSPVTIPAGNATTVTTSGAIGNITVTVNNIIRSKDKNNHAMTVIGTTQGTRGRTFDGIDDYIAISDAPSLYLGNAFSFEIWFYKTNAAGEMLISKDIAPYGINDREWNISHSAIGNFYWETFGAGGGVGQSSTIEPTPALNTWHHAVFTYDGTNMRIYGKGALGSTPTAFTGPLTDTATEVRIGQRSGTEFLHGTIGEIWIYNRALTATEIMNNYLATKWRFS